MHRSQHHLPAQLGRFVNIRYVNLFDDPHKNTIHENTIHEKVLAAMGAVRIPPPVPPTIGHPQSVKDNPPPKDEWVLVWWSGMWASYRSGTLEYDWWMPQPAPPPGVAS